MSVSRVLLNTPAELFTDYTVVSIFVKKKKAGKNFLKQKIQTNKTSTSELNIFESRDEKKIRKKDSNKAKSKYLEKI